MAYSVLFKIALVIVVLAATIELSTAYPYEYIDGTNASKYHPWDDKFRGDGISGDIERTKKSRNKRYWHKGYSRYSGSSSSSQSNNDYGPLAGGAGALLLQ